MGAQSRPELIDELMDAYVEWREECVWLREAYEHWSSGSAEDRTLTFAAYGAALDREQRASAVYQVVLDRATRTLGTKPAPLTRFWKTLHGQTQFTTNGSPLTGAAE